MKQLTKITFLFFIIAIAFSACKEEDYADWKILNDNRYAAELATTDFTKTESGLCYSIIHQGEIQKKPNVNSYVKVRYIGELMPSNGELVTRKIFDSGIYEGYLANTVAGWREAIALLNVGGSMKMFFPYSLGYNSSANGAVPPYSMLFFEVELLDAQN
jgi:FKBP-type peptidyl-prolyl cis-trans isomerase